MKKDSTSSKKIRKRTLETYSDYTKKVLPFAKEKKDNRVWLDNLFKYNKDNKNTLIYADDNFILIEDIRWESKDINELRIVAFFKLEKLYCIRELRKKHIKLLDKVYRKSIKIIKQKYKLNEDQLKVFFHYRPSIWQLHLHFNYINLKTISSSIERAHPYFSVIENLKINSNYYKKVSISCYDELED